MIKRSNRSSLHTLSTRNLATITGGALTLDLDVLALKATTYKDSLTAWGASEIDLKTFVEG